MDTSPQVHAGKLGSCGELRKLSEETFQLVSGNKEDYSSLRTRKAWLQEGKMKGPSCYGDDRLD